MITHYIIMSSSYSKGRRIALDYLLEKEKDYTKVKDIITTITEKCGKDVSISTHFVQTDSKSWKSVYEKDYFFKDVDVIDSVEKFIGLIQEDRVLKGLDVAKYILCKVRCTHLKLEKLVYLCFADYLCKYDKELYKDEIYAYKYGPVVKSVYDRYKRQGYKEIEQDEEDIDASGLYEMPSRSRILFAEDGVSKVKSIDETISKYGKFTANELVDITHKPYTPWDKAGRGEEIDKIIDNEIIKQYHCNEEIEKTY